MKSIKVISVALFMTATGFAVAHAQSGYTNSVLNGCYAHQSTSLVTQTGPGNSDLVGTLCFDGNGNIVGSSGNNGLSGHVDNVDGTMKSTKNQTGTYSVMNLPGSGMGTFQGKCTTHEFVIRNVDANGLAHGFSYILTSVKQGCQNDDGLVASGGAEYQGPLQQ